MPPAAPQALQDVPAWLPWAAGLGVPLVTLGAVVGALLLHRRQFWLMTKHWDARVPQDATQDLVLKVTTYFVGWLCGDGARIEDVEVRYVLPGEPSSALANAGKRDGTANATVLPEPWWEWKWPWLTRLLKGQGPVWLVVVRYDPARPEWSAALVAHELGAHLWPALHGRGWNFDHTDAEADAVEARLKAAVRGE